MPPTYTLTLPSPISLYRRSASRIHQHKAAITAARYTHTPTDSKNRHKYSEQVTGKSSQQRPEQPCHRMAPLKQDARWIGSRPQARHVRPHRAAPSKLAVKRHVQPHARHSIREDPLLHSKYKAPTTAHTAPAMPFTYLVKSPQTR